MAAEVERWGEIGIGGVGGGGEEGCYTTEMVEEGSER